MMLVLASDAAVGMNFLHQSRIIHRDLSSPAPNSASCVRHIYAVSSSNLQAVPLPLA
jgi:hypothetical protein